MGVSWKGNIILIVMDTTRAESLSCYGCKDRTTPHLDSFAEESMLYEQAISPSPWTLPSHASVFTGLYPSSHKVGESSLFLDSSFPTIAEVLSRIGYDTCGVSSNPYVSETFGMTRGFQSFVKTWQLFQDSYDWRANLGIIRPRGDTALSKYIYVLLSMLRGNCGRNAANMVYCRYFANRRDDGAERTNREVDAWLRHRSDGRPFFLFLNYMEPHSPYTPPGSFKMMHMPSSITEQRADELSRLSPKAMPYHLGQLRFSEADFEGLRALYHGEISYLDQKLHELFEILKARIDWDNSVVIVLSDHGENIDDHHLMGHQFSLHDTLIRVPLIIKYPKGIGVKGREKRRVQLVDIFPTILSLEALPSEIDGSLCCQSISLLDLDSNEGRQIIAEYMSAHITPQARDPKIDFSTSPYNRRLYAIYRDEMKLIIGSDGRHELYRVTNDPREQHNLVDQEALLLQQLLSEFIAWNPNASVTTIPTRIDIEMSKVIKDRLCDLGYL